MSEAALAAGLIAASHGFGAGSRYRTGVELRNAALTNGSNAIARAARSPFMISCARSSGTFRDRSWSFATPPSQPGSG